MLNSVSVKIVSPEKRTIHMEKDPDGYWLAHDAEVRPGDRYLYALDGSIERPDPASCLQPEGVHGPSEVVDHASFRWKDRGWVGVPLKDMIVYELHVGAFSPEGTFDGIMGRLDDLFSLGINAIELMPLAQFPGTRNWGYDGTFPYSVQNSYGGPQGLKRLVDACHKRGIAVILDVVYNHLGPEGNYLSAFGPYFTAKYATPWGPALNFDGEHSDQVREYFIQNAIHWFKNYHIDALRLDAVHAIFDMSSRPFLRELADRVKEYRDSAGRMHHLIPESDLNDVRIVLPPEEGGLGHDAQWCDDFHHSLHTLLTGEDSGYYQDFGSIGQMVKAYREGFVYDWQYSGYRKRRHGSSSAEVPGSRLVVFSQNHDQTGNRMMGERLSTLVTFEALKLAAGAVLLSPYVPLLFMGEEYGEDNPFQYFTSHTDPDLALAVRNGRREEFRAFGWKGNVPDPQDERTFLASRLSWDKRTDGRHKVLLDFYTELISIRKRTPALSRLDKKRMEVWADEGLGLVFVKRWLGRSRVLLIMNFRNNTATIELNANEARYVKLLDSYEVKYMGAGVTLPENFSGKADVIIRPFGLALYKLSGTKS